MIWNQSETNIWVAGHRGESRGVSGKHDGFFSECHGGRP